MPIHISLKNSLLMLLCGLFFAVGAAFLAAILLSGPRLGVHYDFLTKYKKPVITREILIINSDEYIEGSDFFTALMTLTEMEAANLVLAGKLSPSATPITVTEAEVRRRFTDEYSIISSNIRSIFDGIRIGTVSPTQAPIMVERVVELTERGRDRLISALIDRDEELIRSVAVFGNFLEAYTKPTFDKDGRLRRVKPIDTDYEHPLYLNLKNRYAFSQIETSPNGNILWLQGYDRKDINIMLDRDGNIITNGNTSFRRVDIELFREYEEACAAMLSALTQARENGVFSRISPEKIPLFLGEHSYELLDELIKSPDSENRAAWIISRAVYFDSIAEFINSSADTVLIAEYEEQIADTDPSNSQTIAALVNKRDELKEASSFLRETYGKLSLVRKKLKDELAQSLCVMGPDYSSEYSALLANAMITGSHVKPVNDKYTLLWSVAALLLVLIIIFMLRPSVLLGLGLGLSVLAAGAFSVLYIYFSYWIDPAIILCSSLAGTLIMFLIKSVYISFRARSFRMAYKSAVPKNVLQSLIEVGKPELNDVTVCYAAVIVIKDFNMFGRENREKPREAGKIKKNFFALAKKALFNAGAVITGYEGDTIIACFGSPLELQPKLTTYKYSDDGKPIKTYHPVDKACALVKNLLKSEKITWRFGIDAGECSFSWSPETGFTVNGSPAVRARVLAAKNARYRTRALISESVQQKLDLESPQSREMRDWTEESVKKIGTLFDDEDAVYRFE